MKIVLFLFLVAVLFIPAVTIAQSPKKDLVKAFDFLKAADKYKKNLSYDTALACFNAASSLFLKHNMWAQVIQTKNEMCKTLLIAGRFNQSISLCNEVAFLIQQHEYNGTEEKAENLNNLGAANASAGNLKKALLNFTDELNLRARLHDANDVSLGPVYSSLAQVESSLGNNIKAIEFAKTALRLDHHYFGPYSEQVANDLIKLGTFSLLAGSSQKSSDYFRKALKASSRNPKIIKLDIYRQLGDVFQVAKPDSAIFFYQIAVDSTKKKFGPTHWSLGSIYLAIGAACLNRDRFSDAEFYFKSALSLVEIHNGVFSPESAQVNYLIGRSLHEQLLFEDRALLYFQRSKRIMDSTGIKNDQRAMDLLENLGESEKIEGLYESAIDHYSQYLELLHRRGLDRENESFVLSQIGECYSSKKDYKKAYEYLLEAKQLLEKTEPKSGEYKFLMFRMANFYRDRGKLDSALLYYQKTLIHNATSFKNEDIRMNPSDVERVSDLKLHWKCLYQKGRTLLLRSDESNSRSDLELSEQTLLLADRLAQIQLQNTSERDILPLEDLFRLIHEEAFEASYRLYLSTGNDSQKLVCYSLIEESKANTLFKALQKMKVEKFANVPVEIVSRRRELTEIISHCEEQLTEGDLDLKDLTYYQEKLLVFRRQLDSLNKKIATTYPKYNNQIKSVDLISLDDLKKSIPVNTLLLDYFIVDSTLYALQIGSGTFEILKSPFNVKDRKLIRDYYIKLTTDTISFADEGFHLFQKLVPKNIQENIDHLIIIPDRGLGRLPFETLTFHSENENTPHKDRSYLIKKYAISYSYSGSMLFENMTYEGDPKKNAGLVSFAPVFSGWASDLPGAQYEVAAIDSICEHLRMKHNLFSKSNASEDTVKSLDFTPFKYAHFSTHGFYDNKHPEYSGILLYCDSTTRGELLASEIYSMDIPVDLLTTSACQTGLGTFHGGEGIIGLTRAFIYAGAKNITSTLWSIADLGTAFFFINYYNEILTNKKKYAPALRDAKLRLLASDRYSHPYYWSPFILIGN
jgi:tetratricopeptide (TPR) repeat protein